MSTTAVREVPLPSGETVPALGRAPGTMGERAHAEDSEIAALQSRASTSA